MARRKAKKSKNKTIKAVAKEITTPKRQRYPIHYKPHAQRLKQQGLSLKEIGAWFQNELGIVIKKSTICSWYNSDNVEKFKGLGVIDKDTNDTCYNPCQRPGILLDLERVLRVHISFNTFKRISNDLTQHFTVVDQALYQKLTDDMDGLLYRYLKPPVPTDKDAQDLLHDINPNPPNINVDNTLDLPGPSHEDVPLRRVPSSDNVTTTFRQIRGVQHDNDNWKRNIKKEKITVEELDSDTDTVHLCNDESDDDDPEGFVDEPDATGSNDGTNWKRNIKKEKITVEELDYDTDTVHLCYDESDDDDDPEGFVDEPDATGSNDGTNWSTSPGVGTQNLSYDLSLDITHDEFDD